jgi:hypothetical protein
MHAEAGQCEATSFESKSEIVWQGRQHAREVRDETECDSVPAVAGNLESVPAAHLHHDDLYA